MPEPSAVERIVPWLLRAAWIAVLLSGGRAIDSAAPDATAATWLGLAGWTLGVAGMAFPAVASLTATRAIVPVAVPVAAVTWIGGADTVDGAVFLGTAVLSAVLAGSSPVGRVFVQSSAYGDEDRHLLRPPLTLLVVAAAVWLVWSSVVCTTAILAVREHPVAAIGSGLAAVAVGALLFPSWHRLSRRWVVLVPAGIVVHDHVAIAETLMVRRAIITAAGLAPAGTDAADLTGGTTGHAIEVRTNESITALLGAAAGTGAGTAIHLTGFLIAPTRPGQVLAAASARRLPVGAIS